MILIGKILRRRAERARDAREAEARRADLRLALAHEWAAAEVLRERENSLRSRRPAAEEEGRQGGRQR